jgi:hypothetical protein
MKRNSLTLGLLALLTLALQVTDADAFFCCRPLLGRRCCGRYCTQITCRPYNAFTPICWGNLVCDGCCPSPCGVANGNLPWGYMGGYGAYAGGMGCCAPSCTGQFYGVPYGGGMSCPGGGCLPDTTITPAPATPAPAPNFTPPPPTPTSYYPYGMYPYGVMQTAYNPYLYRGYYPAYYGNYNYTPNPVYGQALTNAYQQAMYNYYRAAYGR